MPKKLKAFRLDEWACAVIAAEAKELGVSEAVVIAGWAMDHDKGRHMEGLNVLASKPVPAAILNAPVSSKLTDRSTAKPLTRAVQMHQAKD